MPILQVLLVIVVIGFVLWIITRYVPMEPPIKSILIAVVAIALVLWLLQVFNLLAPLGHVRV